MQQPEAPQWKEPQGIGSAEYFGQFLGALREYKQSDPISWASLAGIDPDKYQKFEAGTIDTPPSLEEVNDWSTRWRLNRDEIIDLKISGGYDISAYLGELTADDIRRGLGVLLEDQPRFPLLRLAWELTKGIVASKFTRK